MYSIHTSPSLSSQVEDNLPQPNQNKKFWFIISVIVSLGVLIGAVIGSVGLFATPSSLPSWLVKVIDTVGEPGNWTFWSMLIGGGMLGIGGSIFSIYGLCKKNVTEKMLDSLPKNSYTIYTAFPDPSLSFKSKQDQEMALRYYLYERNEDRQLSINENLTLHEVGEKLLSMPFYQTEVQWKTLWNEVTSS